MMHDPSSAAVGVLGAAGYTGRELVRLLAGHPGARIAFATSESEAGVSLRRLVRAAPDIELIAAADAPLGDVDVVFSCLPHGASLAWVERARGAGARVIDLSADLRVLGEGTPSWAREAVYGLPELYRDRIREAGVVANPGCYPTAAILALAPLVRRNMVGAGPVIINAASGVTGAGRTPKRELLFGEVTEDYRAYAVGNVHRHLAEMRDQIGRLAKDGAPELVFAPHLLPVRVGILETIYVPLAQSMPTEEIRGLLADQYAEEPFVDVLSSGTPALNDVVRTNLVVIGVARVEGVTEPLLMMVAAEDNLIKGAAGQALQNLNVMLGWPETAGLL